MLRISLKEMLHLFNLFFHYISELYLFFKLLNFPEWEFHFVASKAAGLFYSYMLCALSWPYLTW